MKTFLNHKFKIIRTLGDELVPDICELDLTFEPGKEGSVEQYEQKILAIKFWLDAFLDNSIAFNSSNIENEIFDDVAETFSNNLIMSPLDPDDVLFPILIHSKLNAIGGGYIIVTKTLFKSSTSDGFRNEITDEAMQYLPTLNEWLGQRTYFDQPWWNRDDGSTIDIPAGDDDDLNNKPDILIDLFSISSKNSIDENINPAEIIKPKFKPVIIENESEDQ